MGKQFGTVRVKVSLKEKKERVANYLEYNNSTYQKININEYLKADIYDEYVIMHCCDCHHEINFDINLVESLISIYGGDLIMQCPKCKQYHLIPLDLYNNLSGTYEDPDDTLSF